MVKHMETSIELPGVSPAQAWKVFSQFDGWKSWCTFLDVQEAPTQVGGHIRVQFKPKGKGPTTFTPEVLAFEPEKGLRWRGKLWNTNLFFVGEHYFQLQPMPDNKGTLFVHGENFSGMLVALVGGMLANTKKEFQGFNEQFKAKLEEEAAKGNL